MEEARRNDPIGNGDEEVQATVDAWKCVFGFVTVAVVRCAIELKIGDAIDNHETPITLAQLSSVTSLPKSLLYRIMRFLVCRGIVEEQVLQPARGGPVGYVHTPLSRRLIGRGDESMAALVLLESGPAMLLPWLNLGASVSSNQAQSFVGPFQAAHDKHLWRYTEENRSHSDLLNKGMACIARLVVPEIVGACGDLFKGVGRVVDVGGGNGTTLGILVNAFPWLKGINFDLPHVAQSALEFCGVENVGGDMFDSVPKADAAFLMSVLHDWGDEECIKILRNCGEAVPKGTGKIIIIEAVLREEKVEDEKQLEDVKLILDMVMLAHTTTGKERTLKEWDFVLRQSGFSTYDVKHIRAVPSVIVAYNN